MNREKIKGAFWKQSGYPRHSTQNSAIINDAMEFVMDVVVGKVRLSKIN